MKSFQNILRLVIIAYIFILVKNIFQLFFGYLFTSETDIKFYKIYNIQKSNYGLDYVLILIFLYEFLIFSILYFLTFLCLYFLTSFFGNKFWMHALYLIAIYLAIIFARNEIKEFNIPFFVIILLLSVLNWFLFKKILK